MLELVLPNVALRDAFLDAHREWGPGLHEDGFGIRSEDDLETDGGFAAWISRLREGPGSLWWIVEDGIVLGGIAIRAEGDPRAPSHGDIGYGVRPKARGRGVASWALRQLLERARNEGRSSVVAVCRDDNLASIRTLEKCGGRRVTGVDDDTARHYVFGHG